MVLSTDADSYEEYKKNEQGQKTSYNRESQRSDDRAASSSQRANESRSKDYDSRSRRNMKIHQTEEIKLKNKGIAADQQVMRNPPEERNTRRDIVVMIP